MLGLGRYTVGVSVHSRTIAGCEEPCTVGTDDAQCSRHLRLNLSCTVGLCQTVCTFVGQCMYLYRIFVGRHIAGLASAVEARVHCRLLPPAAVCWPVSQEIQTGPPLYATDMDCNECPKASGLENLCFRSSLMESLSCFNTCNLDILQFPCLL